MANKKKEKNIQEVEYSIELLRNVETIRSSIVTYNEHDNFLNRLDKHMNGETPDASISRDPMYGKYNYLVSDPRKIPGEIGRNQQGYQNLIEEIILPNLFDTATGEFIEVIKSPDSSAKDAKTMNVDISTIVKLFKDPESQINHLKEYANSKSSTKNMDIVLKSLIDSDMDTLETRTLTKSSLEFLCWRRSLEDLMNIVPENEKTEILKDIQVLDSTHTTPKQFVDIFRKYHYKNVIDGHDKGDTFPFSVEGKGENESLKFQQKGAGLPDVCLMYKNQEGELFSAHAEPSNTPISDVNRFENNSIIRHRDDIVKDIESAGLNIEADNMKSTHIFLIDSAVRAISKDMGYKKDDEGIKKTLTVRSVLAIGIEFLSKMRNFASTAETREETREELGVLVENRNILVSGLEGSEDNLDRLKDLLSEEKIKDTLALIESVSKTTKSADRKSVMASATTAIIYVLKDEMGISNKRAHEYLKDLIGKKTIDQYASGVFDGFYYGIRADGKYAEQKMKEISTAVKRRFIESALSEGEIATEDLETYIRLEVDKIQQDGMDPAYEDTILSEVAIKNLSKYLDTQVQSDQVKSLSDLIDVYSAEVANQRPQKEKVVNKSNKESLTV